MKQSDLQRIFFVENLTTISWLVFILPFVIFKKMENRGEPALVYFIDASKGGLFVVGITSWLIGVRVEELDFKLTEVRDRNGNLIRLRIAYFDLATIQKEIITECGMDNVVLAPAQAERISTFLSKQILNPDTADCRFGLWQALFLVQVAAWKMAAEDIKSIEQILFMERRTWQDYINRYAVTYGIKVIPIPFLNFRLMVFFRRLIGPNLRLVRSMYFYFLDKGTLEFIRTLFSRHKKDVVSPDDLSTFQSKEAAQKKTAARMAVQYYGQLNLKSPELYSDLFFCQHAPILGEDITLIFDLPRDPLDGKELSEILAYGMRPVVLNPKASSVSSSPKFYGWPVLSSLSKNNFQILKTAKNMKWLRRQVSSYIADYNYWYIFFKAYQIKLYISWFKYDATHCVMADALRQAGGVMTIYQRAFEEFPSPETTVVADIVFGFSRQDTTAENCSNSSISYYVVTGYLGDHRFALLKNYSQNIRRQLQQNGARHILAFFDEGSHDECRFQVGHELMRENYTFLLEKVLSNPRFGLVLKPKTSSSLRKRLGKVSLLLEKAILTGRCHLFEGGTLHSPYPPAIAALAADIAVHGHLYAATAGMEAALAGVPTLLVDREGWSVSKFYRLEKGRVIFPDWDMLWQACEDYWKNPGSHSGFGNWSPLLDELDPFRDGKAAERMGNYLKWLLDGFKEGLRREKVLADCAERYAERWGQDKVFYGIGLDK